jgi:prepilin-type N-terminal cleavage/methylation domain-containing protein/prepilin-type processing-associated H-X9-DG protein
MRRKMSFTLIELLVVVAIIAVLVALLLPSLARARSQAKSMVCLSNVKNLMMAQTTYNVDMGQVSQYYYPNINVPWFYWLRINKYLPPYPSPSAYPWFVPGCDILRCSIMTSGGGLCGYNMNFWGYGSGGWKKLEDFQDPSSKILIGEGTYYLTYTSDSWWWDELAAVMPDSFRNTYSLAPRHNRGGNFGYVDGHAGYVSMDDKPSGSKDERTWIWNY